MYTGQLIERISVLRPVRQTDGFGSQVVTWQTAAEQLHAAVSYGSGSMGVNRGETVYTAGITFRMRWNEYINEYCRIKWRGQLYRITRIERYRQRNELRADAELVTEE